MVHMIPREAEPKIFRVSTDFRQKIHVSWWEKEFFGLKHLAFDVVIEVKYTFTLSYLTKYISHYSLHCCNASLLQHQVNIPSEIINRQTQYRNALEIVHITITK